MPKLVVDRAAPSDTRSVVALLDAAAAWQESRGIDLWTQGQFDDDVHRTIADGDLYVAREDGAIVGCFMLDEGSPRMTDWLVEHGRVPSRGVVGRLAVARDAAGRGLGMELLNAADGLASHRGIPVLRLEFPSENGGLRRYYRRARFSHVGDNDRPGPNGEPWVSSVFERPTGFAS
jgi:ribosomal protein S18 acetylase RimI-like enzyme